MKYLAESYVPRLATAELDGVASRACAGARVMADAGMPVRHLSSIFVPEDEICFHLFEASSAAAVKEAGARARLVFERIAEAVEAAPSAETHLHGGSSC